MRCEVESITAGIDWVSCTLPTTGITTDIWVERGLAVLDKIADGGYDIQPRTMQGYYGCSAGNCFVGSREDGHFIQLTGYHANDHFSDIYRPDLHISRIDVQKTVKLTTMDYGIAVEAYNGAAISNEALPVKRRRKLVIITGSDGGDTLYIGAPSSEQRGRIYNKEVQSEDILFTRCWRYETVYRNELATQLAACCPLRADTRAEWATGIVDQWFRARGVSCLGQQDNGACVALPIAKTLPSEVERRLWWVEHQVAPTVRWLTERGYGERIRVNLGFGEPAASPTVRKSPLPVPRETDDLEPSFLLQCI